MEFYLEKTTIFEWKIPDEILSYTFSTIISMEARQFTHKMVFLVFNKMFYFYLKGKYKWKAFEEWQVFFSIL